MRLLLAATLLPLLLPFPPPLRRGPHPDPPPGAVLAGFPEKVSAWHGVEDGVHDKLHRASHLVVKGPDGKWVDGDVRVAEKAVFEATDRNALPEGKYEARAWGRWVSGAEEPPYAWSFSVKRKK